MLVKRQKNVTQFHISLVAFINLYLAALKHFLIFQVFHRLNIYLRLLVIIASILFSSRIDDLFCITRLLIIYI